VVVVLQQAEHAVFKREGSALMCKRSISLVESLTGFQFYLPHLDGRVLHVKSDAAIIRPGDVKAVMNEGMPQKSNPYVKGNLYIELDVQFPDSLTPAKRAELLRVLGAPAVERAPVVKRKEVKQNEDGMDVETEVDDVPEEVTLTEVDMEAERAARAVEGQQREAYEEDEEGGRRGQPGCRAQ
jgi:DnaJ family protein A protein 2